MTISDVMFEATQDILGYLTRDDDWYREQNIRQEIANVVQAMSRLQRRLDWGEEARPVPDDAMQHLNTELVEMPPEKRRMRSPGSAIRLG